MHIDVAALRQQAWRADKLYADLFAYAQSIGCKVTHDEIMSDDAQARLLARWWQSKIDGRW